MATQRNIGVNPVTFVAGVDFSACPTTQYRFVRAGSIAGEVRLASGASNPGPLGVLQNSPSTGQEAVVVMIGPTKLAVNGAPCTISFGKYIICASDGFGQALDVTTCNSYSATWLAPTATTASVIGEGFFWGPLSGCSISSC
jgi:hypothetical protein